MSKAKQIKHLYGWRADLPSQTPWFDHEKLLAKLPAKLPDFTESYKLVNWVNEQTNNDCTANAGVTGTRLYRKTHGLPDAPLSRRWLYVVTQRLEGNPGYWDQGATIADTEEAMHTPGVPLEASWPYSTSLKIEPSPTKNKALYAEAQKYAVTMKLPVIQSAQAIKACLAAGQPVNFGFRVYPSFETAKVQATGIVPMPSRADLRAGPLGGHANCLADYITPTHKMGSLNSWGSKSGLFGIGLFWFPEAFILDPDYCSDFWTVVKI